MPGGLNDTKDAADEEQKLVNLFKKDVESKVGTTYKEFKALKYRKQVVSGINYYVSVLVDTAKDEVIFLKIFKPLPGSGDAQLTGYLTGKTSTDELSGF